MTAGPRAPMWMAFLLLSLSLCLVADGLPLPDAAAPAARGAALGAPFGPAPWAASPVHSAGPEPAGGMHVFRFAPAPTPVPLDRDSDSAPGSPPALQFRCPSASVSQSVPTAEGDFTTYGCPFRIYDGASATQGYPFGNPQIAVNPANEAEVAFASLHGEPATGGPTPRARSGLTHTTFTTADQGLDWNDQPTQFGASADGLAYLGESASIAMDSQGNMYIAYLWVLPNGNATTGYGSAIGLYKAGQPHEPNSVSSSYSSQKTLTGRTPHNTIPRIDVVYVPPFQPPTPLANVTANGTVVAPATEAEVGHEANPVNHSRERVAAVWFEKAADWRNSTTGYAGWIDAAVTDSTSANVWNRLDRTQLIGPCRDASNPVAWNGLVYIACQADRGYIHRSRARIGDLDIWSIDPATLNTTLVSTTGLLGGHPLLAATPDGYMALVAVTHRPDQTLQAETAFGWYGRSWTSRGDIGAQLHRYAALVSGDVPLRDASINALAVSQDEKTALLVYMEWGERNNGLPAQSAPKLPDPTNPAPPTPRLTDYHKYIVAYNECQFPIAAVQMQLGTSIDPNNLQAYTKNPGVFDDFQDGLAAYHEPAGSDLFYFAVNDYGAMQYGAVVAAGPLFSCPVVPPVFQTAQAALPQALTTASAATTTVGAGVGVAAVAMVTYLLAVKRRVAHFAVAQDK